MKIDNLMENSFVTGLEGGLGPQAFMYPSVVEMRSKYAFRTRGVWFSVKGNCIKSRVPVLVLFEEDCCVSLLINIVICQISPDITKASLQKRGGSGHVT